MNRFEFSICGIDCVIYQTGADSYSLQLGQGFYNWHLPLSTVLLKTETQLVRIMNSRVANEMRKAKRKISKQQSKYKLKSNDNGN